MRNIFTIIAVSVLLSGCLPLALFANGSGSEYKSYRNNLGVMVSGKSVNTLCLAPALRLAIWDIEGHFGKKIVMNSGYRTPWHNYSVGGASKSYHTSCMAADFFIPGVSKAKLIQYARRMSGIGGLGCYPGKKFIHIDVRDRKWGSKGPVTFKGC
jgi:zinc D-Ala-D-Ala carboxypeptidase